MTISELIEELKKFKDKHGDLVVELSTYRWKTTHNSAPPTSITREVETGQAPISGVYLYTHGFSSVALIKKELC